ncbi:MAG TPA: SpoIIE family protein phosphatase [Spirochaetota bacterium]|nr:SpoIIE family protein phosphatase [Spirochaetota bacterium]HOL56156.1 SpoIIE family protein phosphatase [Spirochaetota bacterium]HPP05242.1 SpoIIE family protein phosphatase [Spirochaetota bacterium]
MNDVVKSKNLWGNLKIRWKLLAIILPTAIIPLIIIVVFTSFRLYQYIEKQGHEFYTTLLTQVRKNMEFLYGQYARALPNMLDNPQVIEALNVKQYKSAQHEMDTSALLIGDVTTKGGLRNTFEEKIDGRLYVVELDKKSIIDNTQYKVHRTVNNQPPINMELLFNDPLFKKLREDNSIKLIFGKPDERILGVNTLEGQSPVMIYPYYPTPPEKKEDTFTKFLYISLNNDFIPQFYKDIIPLKFGTLYILDFNNNIISLNHPSDEDELNFDETTMQYIKEKDMSGNILSYEDYEMLNVDKNILNIKEVKDDLLDKMDPEHLDYEIFEKKHIITYKGKKFLTIVEYGDQSWTKYIYFHPISQFTKPIWGVVRIIIIISLIVSLIIIAISYLFSKTFTTPINTLAEATKVIAKGDYTHFVKAKYDDEIGQLSENFNQMIKNIKAYQDKLLSAEREKSELELASRIQTCLLPSIPYREHYEITATMIPAAEVGGDYYDLIGETNGRIWFGIGDVSGHGLTSGLIMMMAQTAFNTILLNDPDISSDKLIAKVNRVMYQNIKQRLGEDHFMTLSFMVADPDGTVHYAGAHLDILVYRHTTKEVERIETLGVWLGLVPDIERNTVEKSFKLESGDLMFLYTDGLIEATNDKNEQYDMERLINKLKELGDKPVKEIEEAIINEVFSFLHEQKDDITFVIARKK